MTPADLKKLAKELTAHMVANGVRSMRLSSSPAAQMGESGWSVELELDPAAQVLAAAGEATPEGPPPKRPGECPAPGCEKPGGWMRTAYCRSHFHTELRGSVKPS